MVGRKSSCKYENSRIHFGQKFSFRGFPGEASRHVAKSVIRDRACRFPITSGKPTGKGAPRRNLWRGGIDAGFEPHQGPDQVIAARGMVMERGAVWWAELPDPVASEPGFRHPAVIIQPNAFNRSRIRTIVAVLLTSNLRLPEAPGNVLIAAADSGSLDRGRRRPRPSIS